MSREHVMPRWLASRFPDLGEVDYVRAFQAADGDAERHVRPGQPFDQTVRDFCLACNNGWMAQLEADTAPILTPLLADEARSLDALEQQRVATWATKTVLTVGPTNLGHELVASEEAYRWFWEKQVPLPGSLVWLGRYAGGEQWPISLHHHGMVFGEPGPDGQPGPRSVHGFHSVFAIGNVVCCVFLGDSPEGPIATGGGGAERILIWPTSGNDVWWPPARSYESTADLQEASRLTPGGLAEPLVERGRSGG